MNTMIIVTTDKYFYLVNKTYGCIPVANIDIDIEFERYLFEKRYKFCEITLLANFTVINKINNEVN